MGRVYFTFYLRVFHSEKSGQGLKAGRWKQEPIRGHGIVVLITLVILLSYEPQDHQLRSSNGPKDLGPLISIIKKT